MRAKCQKPKSEHILSSSESRVRPCKCYARMCGLCSDGFWSLTTFLEGWLGDPMASRFCRNVFIRRSRAQNIDLYRYVDMYSYM